MPYHLKLAFKNIFRQKKRSFSLGINYLVIALLILLVLSFSEGVKQNFSGNLITAAAGHINISGETVRKGKTILGVTDYPKIEAAIRDSFGPEVRIITRYKLSSTVYYRGLSKSLSFQGIKPASDTGLESQLDFRSGGWSDFAAGDNTALFSRDSAEYLGLSLGDELVIATRTRFGAFNTATIKVAGIYDSANYFVQGIVITHFDFLQALDLSDKNVASSIFVYFPNLDGLGAKRDQLMGVLSKQGFKTAKPANDTEAISAVAGATPQYKVEAATVNEDRLKLATVNEVIGLLSQVLAIINGVGAFLAIILLFITAVSIFINMRMTINDRIQEIGTLRRDVVAMLVFENVFLSLLFVGLGLILGAALIAIVANLLNLPPAGILSLFLDKGHLVLIPTLGAVGLIAVTILAFTALFSYFPARHAGRITAAVALGKTF
jgi:ABC-type lipoprotein release transport system permease subunit